MIETSSNTSQTTRTTDLLCLKSSNTNKTSSRDNSISNNNLIRKSEDEINLKSVYNNNNAHLNLKVNN